MLEEFAFYQQAYGKPLKLPAMNRVPQKRFRIVPQPDDRRVGDPSIGLPQACKGEIDRVIVEPTAAGPNLRQAAFLQMLPPSGWPAALRAELVDCSSNLLHELDVSRDRFLRLRDSRIENLQGPVVSDCTEAGAALLAAERLYVERAVASRFNRDACLVWCSRHPSELRRRSHGLSATRTMSATIARRQPFTFRMKTLHSSMAPSRRLAASDLLKCYSRTGANLPTSIRRRTAGRPFYGPQNRSILSYFTETPAAAPSMPAGRSRRHYALARELTLKCWRYSVAFSISFIASL
jgi:hypothetical protein